jgi:quinohemoprotein ethanol dehydrogenase
MASGEIMTEADILVAQEQIGGRQAHRYRFLDTQRRRGPAARAASTFAVWALTVLPLLPDAFATAAAAPADANRANWESHNNIDEDAYSALNLINKMDVKRLGLAWSLNLDGEQSLEATPLAVDGILYFTGSHAVVYAVDAASGKLKWKFDPQTWRQNPGKLIFMFGVNRGVAYASGRVFSGTLDGRLLALDAKTGSLLWSVQTMPLVGPKCITGAPRTFNGKVIIGTAGSDSGERGYVTAYDAASGRQIWRFYTTPGAPEEDKGDAAMERAAATWSGAYWKTGTGGGVWDSMTFDSELNQIYLGTGNAGPYDPDQRSPGKGDNLYTASIVAVDADTGRYVWHYQVNPRDAWDFDSTQQMALAVLPIGGIQRKILMQAPKNGFFYVLDRQSGQLLSAEKLGKVTWAKRIDLVTGRPVEAADARYESGDSIDWPSPLGAHSWQSMSFSSRSGLAYIPYMQVGVHLHKGKPLPGAYSVGGVSMSVFTDDKDGNGALIAWDPVAQKARWRVQLPTLWNGGALSTAGDLVLQGSGDGYLSAYDANSGERLWQFNAGLGIIGAPMTYTVGGRQYVSILVGYGGATAVWSELMPHGWKFGAQPRRLLTFGLDGKAALPPTAPRGDALHAIDDATIDINPADVAAGEPIFNLACSMCHGLNLRSPGSPGPDLRESRIALSEQGVWSVVHDGALLERGMPQYTTLDRQQVRAIYAYIRAGARKALETGDPSAAAASRSDEATNGEVTRPGQP